MTKTMTKYYCDRCGKEMAKNFTFYYATYPKTVIKVQHSKWEDTDLFDYADLCDECRESFKCWWEKSSASPTEAESEVQE